MMKDSNYSAIVNEIKTLIHRGMNPMFVPEYVAYKFPDIHCTVISLKEYKIFVWKYKYGISHYIHQ